MGRHVGGHTYCNTSRAIHQQVGQFGGQHHRFIQGTVIIGYEIHRFLVNISQHLLGNAVHANLGITHGCCRISVNGAEVTLAVSQWVA